MRGRCNGAKSITESADLHENASGRGAFCKPAKADPRGPLEVSEVRMLT